MMIAAASHDAAIAGHHAICSRHVARRCSRAMPRHAAAAMLPPCCFAALHDVFLPRDAAMPDMLQSSLRHSHQHAFDACRCYA